MVTSLGPPISRISILSWKTSRHSPKNRQTPANALVHAAAAVLYTRDQIPNAGHGKPVGDGDGDGDGDGIGDGDRNRAGDWDGIGV